MEVKKVQLKLYLVLLITALGAAVPGCGTKKPALKPEDPITRTVQDRGVTMTLTFLTEESLKGRFGNVNNPFLTPSSILGLNNILAFELVIDIEPSAVTSPGNGIVVPLKQVKLSIEGKSIAPTNRFHLTEFWENRVRHETTVRGRDLAKMKLIIKREVVPNTVEIGSGSSSRGFLVFMGKFDIYSEKRVVVPVYDGTGNSLGNFDFTF